MVGVPGKDGPCTTCHRRKKRCDKKTPFCSQCIAAGLFCEGYTRHHSVWLNSTDGENRTYAKSARVVSGQTLVRSVITTITLHESLARVAREDRYVGLYLAAFLPNGRLFSAQASQISSAGWLRHLDALCRSEKTLRLITLAHGLSMLATRDHDSQLRLKGFEAHRMALHQMHIALHDPQRATGDGILAAVRLFRFYEILYGADKPNGTPNEDENRTQQVNGYYAHTDGEMALFMNRGCHRKWSQAGRYLLVSGRIVSFILGVGRRKRSPFSDSKWMTAPWKNTPKSPLDELSDILVQIPGILEELDTIQARPVSITERGSTTSDPNRTRVVDLLEKCSRLEKALLTWRDTMRDALRTYDHIHYSETNNNPLPTPQVDREFAVLHMSCLYWSCSILLYTTIHMAATAHGEADDHHLTDDELHFAPSSSSSSKIIIPFSSSPECPNYYNERNPTLHAHRIIHTMPLSHGPFAGGYGALCSTFPLGIALRYLLVAHFFPHDDGSACANGGGGGSHHLHHPPGEREREREFLRQTVSQPFMRAYTARFVGHLHKVDNAPGQSTLENEHEPGWYGAELRMRRWWFGPRVG
ncbi:hypothetical protein BJX62DRAFT_249473 [Aspergillus germanicus]